MILKNTPKYTQTWFVHNIPNWSRFLGYLKFQKDKRFLEIGCFEGMATRWLMETLMTEEDKIEVIDTFKGSIEHLKLNINTNDLLTKFLHNIDNSPNVIIHQGKSEDILRNNFSRQKEIFDFIYIDGDHHAKNVMKDAVLSWPLLKKGGILIFDDYDWRLFKREIDNPFPAINTFCGMWQDEIEVLIKSCQVILMKI